jgi:hypothetical protein
MDRLAGGCWILPHRHCRSMRCRRTILSCWHRRGDWMTLRALTRCPIRRFRPIWICLNSSWCPACWFSGVILSVSLSFCPYNCYKRHIPTIKSKNWPYHYVDPQLITKRSGSCWKFTISAPDSSWRCSLRGRPSVAYCGIWAGSLPFSGFCISFGCFGRCLAECRSLPSSTGSRCSLGGKRSHPPRNLRRSCSSYAGRPRPKRIR